MRLTISGPPGSGKTTACNRLSEELGLKAVVFGKIFRELAAEKGISLAELGALAERDPSIDKGIDERIIEIAKANDDIILESRLSAHMCVRNNIPAFKIYLQASPDVRISRIGVREGDSLEKAKADTIERQKSEAKRYKMYYDIDIDDMSVYDLVVNTDDLDPDGVLDEILKSIEGIRC
ncbi:MAG: AAA family ATPase [Candidatus Methanomethylophilaceae archaeon]|nr:AAA family ATPase [Candidatus Methanomethylophilaceae archaeon]